MTSACAALPGSVVAATTKSRVSGVTPRVQGTIVSCRYSLTGNRGSGVGYLDISLSRGSVIYQQVTAGGGFTGVPGLGQQAAYNAQTGHLIVRAGDAFVSLSLPTTLGSGPAQQRAQAVDLAKHVLDRLG